MMYLLYAICGWGAGFISGVAIHALTSYKRIEKLEKENNELQKKEVVFTTKYKVNPRYR